MEQVNRVFLAALKASLENKKVSEQENLSVEEWLQFFQMAEMHHVLPMLYEAVYHLPSMNQLASGHQMYYKRKVLQYVAMQAMQTSAFLPVYESLRVGGLRPCVVKGIVCRYLYPNPDARLSSDEDVLIGWKDYEKAHEILLAQGLVVSDPNVDRENDYEVPYGKAGSPLYIELHKSLFSPKSEAYGDLNVFFTDMHERLIEEEIAGVKVLTFNHTDHLFYLICHAFKHFLHSGFGLRQVCDIILFANAHGHDIDWDAVLEKCQEIRADLFAAAMFKIGCKYLTFDMEKAHYPLKWRNIEVDETAMLEDLLASGIYGQSDMSRKHSSNITLNAVIADKRGQKAKSSVLGSVFLPVKSLENRFTYLRKYPFLLPVAWVQRVWIYQKETGKKQTGNQAGESIKLGKQRVDLMRQYGIIK